MTIGELSRRSGVSQSALRFYERQGLISAERTDGNQRRYHGTTLRKVAVIQAGKAAGIPLERIREAFDALPTDRPPTKRDWARLSRSWADELDERIAMLQSIRGRLTTCIGCGCLSLKTCALLNPGDEAAHLGGGAHYLRRVSPRGRHPGTRAL
ncbi:MAG: redox-sensitive transcriptional activator SoxR [Actinobacteria bacterium]|nr:redox-sensitive transcriptional activator SoxR [Actinomycetota bacterium]MBV8481211.1 redox-sensitive transcriptional activator SoxR [Actinomycetota bacterium]